MVDKKLNKEVFTLIVIALISGALIGTITDSVKDVGIWSLAVIWKFIVILLFITDIAIYAKYGFEIINSILEYFRILN